MSALTERLKAHAANLAASLCEGEEDDDSDVFLFSAEEFLLAVFHVERGMDDGADGWSWGIFSEAGPVDGGGYSVSVVGATFEAWEALVAHIRATGTHKKPKRTQERDSKAIHLLMDAFGALVKEREAKQ